MQTNNSKEKVRQLQNKLYLTAKKCDSRRFHALYDKVYRDDVLFEAWKRVKANKGSSGVDGIGIEDIEEMGIEKYLSEIKSELMDGKYKPSPVKRVMIPKPDGSERPLGIPTVKDRIVQMATKIAIEPVFEADFRDCSYGFRPKRSARQALEVVRKACNNKGYYVVDADIEKFFDNVNQDKLMKLAEQRISDRRILKLIRQWLVSGVLYGNVLTISELGTSQGSVISPLLANIYLNTLDRLWEKYGLTHGILVRYADDTVIICKNKKNANHALNLLQYIMAKLDLKLHPVKTKIVSMWDGKEGFDFLGMHHRRMTTEKIEKYSVMRSILAIERANYASVKVNRLEEGRTDISLDGNWLFMPGYQLDDKEKAVSTATDDKNWHVMSVPNFWNPIRIWLHGETMPSPTGPQPKGVSDTYYQQETDRCEGYTFDYRKTNAAWYRQWIELPAGVEGKNMTLTFDAVSKVAEIYINGELAGSHIGMYGEIQVDGSKLLKPFKNLLACETVLRIARVPHDRIAEHELAARIEPAANRFRNAAVRFQKINVRNIV